jgi:Na+/H+ antiporter NhaD/arsenite permease-like protein
MTQNIIIFCITYAGIAIGGIPGLALDRTGIALLGAIAMLVFSAVTPAEALSSIDFSALILLYGLMIVSAQFRLSGFYALIAGKIGRIKTSPEHFLMIIMASTAALSAFLTNDIVCLAFTPVIITAVIARSLNPVPYCIACAVSANIGSAATIIGNPQNMLIGQTGALGFGAFTLWNLVPVFASLAAAYFIMIFLFRGKLSSDHQPIELKERRTGSDTFSNRQSIKGAVILSTVLIFFFTPVPRELTVATAAGLLLLSRTVKSIELLAKVDWNLITLFCGLFIVIEGISKTGLPMAVVSGLDSHGFSIHNGFILTAASSVLSNIVSNVPAVMLIIPHLDKANPSEWYALAASSTFAGNFITIGSIANLIVFQIASTFGVKISFIEHAKIGIPVTIISLAILVLWMMIV